MNQDAIANMQQLQCYFGLKHKKIIYFFKFSILTFQLAKLQPTVIYFCLFEGFLAAKIEVVFLRNGEILFEKEKKSISFFQFKIWLDGTKLLLSDANEMWSIGHYVEILHFDFGHQFD